MEVDTLIRNLTDEQKLTLVELLLDSLTGEDDQDQSLDYPDACPHCSHQETVRNGSIRGKPRFKCKGCNRTFSHDAFKLRFRSGKGSAYWKKYLELMFDGFSLRKIVQRMHAAGLPICLNTSFTWRHKVLTVLRMATRTNLSGLVEADETFFRLSFKGQRKDLGRAPHKRGKPASKRGISKEQVCVSAGVDRQGGTYLKPVCLGSMKILDFKGNLARHIDWENSTFLTDGHKSYVPPDAYAGHIRIKGHGKGPHHINNVNNCHYLLDKFLRRFNGVATKYLDNYLAFWQWLNLDRKPPLRDTRGWVAWQEIPAMKMNLS